MKRALALRMRIMPSATGQRHALALKSWRDPARLQQSRLKSTTQEYSRAIDPLESAVIHGARVQHQGHQGPTILRNERPHDKQPHSSKVIVAPVTHTPSSRTNQKRDGRRMNPPQMGGRVGKRRAETSPGTHPARKRHQELPSQFKDEAYIRQNFHVPTAKDYPKAPIKVWSDTKEMMHNLVQAEVTLHSRFSPLRRNGFECSVTYRTLQEDQNIAVSGEGPSKKAAERAAYVYLLAKLHELGTLQNVLIDTYDKTRLDAKLDKKILIQEADAKMDIYNYAARFDAVPKIDLRTFRTRGKKAVDITVSLSEQGLAVTGRGNDIKSAEVAAALQFKAAAEKYHAEHGGESIIIKDSTSLTTNNCYKFFEFYKIIHPGVAIDVSAEQNTKLSFLGATPHRVQILVNQELVGEPVEMITKKKAEDLAYLTAAIHLKRKEPDIYPKFLRALSAGNGEILRPLSIIDMPVDEDCVLVMRETLLSVRNAGLPDKVDDIVSEEESSTDRKRLRRQLAPSQTENKNWQLQKNFSAYLKNPGLEELRRKKSELPMNQYREKVLDLVNNNTYSIIVGATGSGKTTQVPQILFESAISKGQGAACNIVCTQPRRIAATSVARRVAEERAERLQDTVGYHVRFDAKLPSPGGSVNYCTTGILLQQLQHSPDEVMDGVSCLIIDEVHERDILIDFLLIILKKVMAQRIASGKTTPKVVLMSATMDTDLFASYFKNGVSGKGASDCPALSVPGRTFPVKEIHLQDILAKITRTHSAQDLQVMRSDPATREYLEGNDKFSRENPITAKDIAIDTSRDHDFMIDWKLERKLSSTGEMVVSNEKDDALIPFGLVATTIAHIAKTTAEGAVLVFLPGLDEILKINEALRRGMFGIDFNDESKFKLSILHSSVAGGHTEVFQPVPRGCRKIILATNIAETSITIPDVQYVVDTGKLREKQYDQIRRITKLQCTWISKSNSKQRAGRAGRVQNGNYYALFSSERYNSMRAIGLPEMLRSDLQEICLDIKAQAFKSPVREFLAEAIEPPASAAVDASVMNLQALDALTDDEKLTPLGRLLASLPVHPSLGKMIILGVLFRCLDPMLILGAAAAERSIFTNPLDARREAQEAKLSFVQGSGSDHIALLNAIRELRRLRDSRGESAMRDFAFRNFIHFNSFKTVDATARQIEDILVEAGLIPYTSPQQRASSEYGDPSLNENSSKTPLIKALALAGLHPNLAVSTGGRTFRTPGEKNTIVHPSSVNATIRDRHGDSEDDRIKFGTLFTYSTMARSNDGNSIFLRDTTESTPLMATLFGGKLHQADDRSNNILELDGWLPFYVKSSDRRASKTILEFRKALERLLTGAFQDLSSNKDKGQTGGKTFLADAKVREMFADGLVEVLDRDVKVKEVVAKRGWKIPGWDAHTPAPSMNRTGALEGRGGTGRGRVSRGLSFGRMPG